MGHRQVIHRFWAGSEMPQQYREYGEQWLELNPGWKLYDWTEGTALLTVTGRLAEVIGDLYRRDGGAYGIEMYVQMADVLGYHLVHQYGGVYVNCDIQPLRPLEDSLPDSAWASYENDIGDVVNAAIGAPDAGDEFWSSLLDALPDRYFANPTAEMVKTTGPGLLTDHYRANRNLLHVFPVETFNSVHWGNIAPGGDASGFTYPDTALGVHHWGHKKDHRSNHVETRTQR